MSYSVLFHPGSYGTYLSWCIYTYSELNRERRIELPFSSGGGAHLFHRSEGIKIVQPTHTLPAVTKNVIFIEPLLSKCLEYLNNQHMKEHDFDHTAVLHLLDYKKKLDMQWQTEIIERWHDRELLSFFLPDFFKNSFKEYNYELTNYNSINVTFDDIIYSLNETILKILDFFKLTAIDTIKKLPDIHDKFYRLQKNINKDEIALRYADAAINRKKFVIENCTLYDEAWIQHLLRMQGYNIKCWKLNQFPYCASELTNLLERNNE